MCVTRTIKYSRYTSMSIRWFLSRKFKARSLPRCSSSTFLETVLYSPWNFYPTVPLSIISDNFPCSRYKVRNVSLNINQITSTLGEFWCTRDTDLFQPSPSVPSPFIESHRFCIFNLATFLRTFDSRENVDLMSEAPPHPQSSILFIYYYDFFFFFLLLILISIPKLERSTNVTENYFPLDRHPRPIHSI